MIYAAKMVKNVHKEHSRNVDYLVPNPTCVVYIGAEIKELFPPVIIFQRPGTGKCAKVKD